MYVVVHQNKIYNNYKAFIYREKKDKNEMTIKNYNNKTNN